MQLKLTMDEFISVMHPSMHAANNKKEEVGLIINLRGQESNEDEVLTAVCDE